MRLNTNPQEGKISLRQTLVSVGILIIVLCAGISWGSVINYSPMPECTVNKSADTAIRQGAAPEETDAEYKTFSEADVYFTFEYPSDWIYERQESNPGEEYNETFHIFYTDSDKKQEALVLHYPMYETALDTCLKFDQVATYSLSQFETNEPGTFVNYLKCYGTDANPDAPSRNLGSQIRLERGTLVDGDVAVSTIDGTMARIQWNEDKVDQDTVDHIAHSIKVIK